MLRDVRTSLRACGLTPAAILDTGAVPPSGGDLPVLHPASIINRLWDGEKNLIVIATTTYRTQAEAMCKQFGLVRGRDFIDYLSISRPVAVVEVSGLGKVFNVAPDHGPPGFMPLKAFRKVLQKLLQDIPHLSAIELSAGHEPLLNPEIAEIIRETEARVPCIVATAFLGGPLERVLLAQPSELQVVVDGIERSLGEAHEAKSDFMRRIKLLGELQGKISASTVISVRVHPAKRDTEAGRQTLMALAREAKLELMFCRTHPVRYDELLRYRETGDITQKGVEVLENLPWDLERIVALCKRDIGLPCLCQRVFPIIRWDLSVSLCHVYDRPTIHPNYLEAEWEDLLKTRHSASQCETCQKHALHRLDLDVLERKYPNETQQG